MDSRYDNYGDILEYGEITDGEAVDLCNKIIKESLLETDHVVLESMYHAVLNGVSNRNIASRLDTNIIIESLDKFDEEVLDFIITILAYTGEKEYIEIIKSIGHRYNDLDVEEALIVLNASDKRKL